MDWEQIGADIISHLIYFFTNAISTIWGIVTGLFLFLIGEPSLALKAMFALFVFDIITRLIANAVNNGGYIQATRTGKIRSKLVVQGLISKMFSYFIVLSIAQLSTYVIPIDIINGAISASIYGILFFVEAQSCAENLLEADPNNRLFKLLAFRFKNEADKLAGNASDNTPSSEGLDNTLQK